jgi:RNA ligase
MLFVVHVPLGSHMTCPVHLLDLMDVDLFTDMRTNGFITITEHPRLPLEVLNYTAQTQYSRTWNDCTRVCRGLIIDAQTSRIVSRPFPKFFNLGELADDEIPAERFDVFEKVDGSLGILYPEARQPSGYAIATRGSFTSDQALHATGVLNTRYNEIFHPHERYTYLFEILYPSNRIVVDYHGMDDLVLLDIIDNATGQSVDMMPAQWAKYGWPGPVVKTFEGIYALADLLTLPQPDNFEGYVVRFKSGMRVKVKMDEYVRLHRLVTGVSTKTVHEFLAAGRDLDELVDRVPDEFHQWVQKTVAEQQAAYMAVFDAAKADAARALKLADTCMQPKGSKEYRKDFAFHLQGPYKSIAFLMYDNKNVRKAIWRLVTPQFEKPFSNDEGE